jgi:hypothetical protein
MWENQSIECGDYYNLGRYTNTCVPQMKLISQADGGSLESQYWQQDGTTVHRTVKVLRYLDGQFGERMLAMNSTRGMDWASRSPDLNPLDYFVWGYLKSKVFQPMPKTMTVLKNRIKVEVDNLDQDMVRRAVWDLRSRARRVVEKQGCFIEG